MVQTRVFKSNKSQAVRLPKAVEMPDGIKDVDVVAIGNTRNYYTDWLLLG